MPAQSSGNLGNTRGGLRPATITNLSTNAVVKFQFNPYEFTISKSNSWTQRDIMGHNVPSIAFQQGGAQTLSLKLYFDTQDAGSDVRALTGPLWTMMMVDESNENQTTGKGQPPPVAFAWGSLYFRSIITQMSETFSLFSDQGVPLRSEISISLQQYVDEVTPAAQTSDTGSSQATPRSTVVQSGDRIDTVSSNLNGGSSNWRDVAEANNVDNPLNMRRGTSMRSGG